MAPFNCSFVILISAIASPLKAASPTSAEPSTHLGYGSVGGVGVEVDGVGGVVVEVSGTGGLGLGGNSAS